MTPQKPTISLTQFISTAAPSLDNSLAFDHKSTAMDWFEQIHMAKSVYIHIPFCFHKCHYCDFYSIAGGEDQYESFVHQLDMELSYIGNRLSSIDTIFVGGGTPTIFEVELFGSMLSSISRHIPRSEHCEWTIEANPETVTREKAQVMSDKGINRVSIGAQSFHLDLLKTLERWHEPSSVRHAVKFIHDAGIGNVNLDLIYAIPGQTECQLIEDLMQAIELEPKHISCYTLMYEPNTPLLARLESGDICRVDHDTEASMFDCVRDVLRSHSYNQYEISNFAQDGFECKHNIVYWMNDSWWPIGPSASGHLAGRRWKNTPAISRYISGHPLPSVIDVEVVSDDCRAGESFMVGLRMLKGISRDRVEKLIELSNNRWRALVIDGYIHDGFLNWQEDYLTLTPDGIRFADTVMAGLLMQEETITDTKEQA